MTEFGSALLGSVQKSFAGYLMTDKDLARLSNRVRDGTDYEAANEYAARVGELLAKSIDDNTKTLAFMSRDVAQEVLTPLLTENHEIVSQAAATVQKNMNDAAGIGMGVLTADLDTNRINGLIDKVSSYDTYEQAKWVLNEPVVNYSQAVVDQTIRKNAQAHYKAGFEPIVIRKTETAGTKTRLRKIKGRSYKYTYAVPCKWCAGLEGVYKYSEVKNTGNDVFRRHEACRCIIIYKDANKTVNVRTQHEWTGEDADSIAQRINGVTQAQAQPAKPNNPLSKSLTEAQYNQMTAVAEKTPENSRKVWGKFVDRIKVGSLTEKNRAYALGDYIHINLREDMKPTNDYDKPWQTFFHESHHVIDKIAGRDSGKPLHYSAIYKNGLFPQTIYDETQALVESFANLIKPLIDDGNLDELINIGAIPSGDKRWYESGWYSLKYSKNMAYRAVQTEIMKLPRVARCDLSDILEGATNGKIQCGFGHGTKYWRDRTINGVRDGLATEAFAEMSDSLFTNPDSLATIQRYLPNSWAVYEDMINELAG